MVGTPNKLLKISMYDKLFSKHSEEVSDEKIIDIIVIDNQNDENALALIFEKGINKIFKYKYNTQEGYWKGYIECKFKNMSINKSPLIQCSMIKESVANNTGSIVMAGINNYSGNNENEKNKGYVVLYDIQLADNK